MSSGIVVSIFMIGLLLGISLYSMYKINNRLKLLEDRVDLHYGEK